MSSSEHTVRFEILENVYAGSLIVGILALLILLLVVTVWYGKTAAIVGKVTTIVFATAIILAITSGLLREKMLYSTVIW